ncbi:exonuclease domain-containing protein [Vibrio coralliirubri]|uniref:3'-5' exonuclease n=1 Tax=Vibrio coralliirubri TaxID=1516159 RepID=UPI002284D5ED|nr:exonuclease domain-containing protein [Vibrio coralliirubri]
MESTGLGVDSHPIEVAFLSLTGESDDFLINPQSVEHWIHWDFNSQDVHGITRDECIRDGLSVYDAATRLNNQLNGCLVISDCAGYDANWIDMIFEEANLERLFKIIDIRQFIFGTGQHPNKVKGFHNVKNRRKIPHRALADCEIIRWAATHVNIFQKHEQVAQDA